MLNQQYSEEPHFKLSEILRAVREAVVVIGGDMRLRALNDAAQNVLSRPEEDIRGKRLSEVLRDFALHEAFELAIRKDKTSEIRLEVLGDQQRVFDVLVSPLALGSESAAIGFFYEATRVERLERIRQEFLSNISHELRTPLTSILAFVETLEEGALEDDANNRKFLEVIRKNAERMRLLVDDISELSSIESGNIAVEPISVDSRQIATDVIASLSAAAEQREIELKNNIPETTMITADPARLHQMLTNLVDNAIKFSNRGGKVVIKHEGTENGDVLVVSNTGEGILKEHQQRIFERFYRVDKARSLEIGGTGLGLAIVKHLAIQHGGEVSVASVAGEETSFRILFPKRSNASKD